MSPETEDIFARQKLINEQAAIHGDSSVFPISAGDKFFAGLDKRTYIATAALQGLLASKDTGSWKTFAECAVQAADALIAELNRKEGKT